SSVEPDGDVFDGQSARERDAVPLVEPVEFDLVAGFAEGIEGKLCLGALDFLHRQHVDVFTSEPVDDAPHSAADRVDVPGRYTHGTTVVDPGDEPRSVYPPTGLKTSGARTFSVQLCPNTRNSWKTPRTDATPASRSSSRSWRSSL